MSALSPATRAELGRIRQRLQLAEDLEAVVSIRERTREAEVAALYRAWRADAVAVPDPVTGTYCYAEVSASTVHPDVRSAAGFAIAWATMDNGLPSLPELSWMVPETAADRTHVARWGRRDWAWMSAATPVAGLAQRQHGCIWLAATLDVRDVMEIAVHEVRHIAQPADMPESEIEPDAYAYAARVERSVRRAYVLAR